ncbi:MAG: CDP-alcohol phosphatidyltransferase family protein [Terriglobia bacterium]
MIRKAILLNLTDSTTEGWRRLAGLPLLLRAFLSAQRAGIQEIVLVGGKDPARLLARDRRVRAEWRWVPLEEGPQAPTEVAALQQVRGKLTEDFLLVFADSVFDAQAAASLLSQGLGGRAAAVALPARGSAAPDGASLYLVSPDFLRLLEDEAAAGNRFERVETFAAHLAERGQVTSVEVAGRLWPRTRDRERIRTIHRELTHFNLKPSDGIFARFNKLVVAQPLIRLFLRTPATPNFVTGLGLLFALGSAWAFVQGSYWWCIGGALLSYVSAIMDHADGMVARLKFLESDFGVWFETAVDYASYFCIFVGLSIGLYRETGFAHHLFVGGLFLFGGVMSFVVQTLQRRLASGDNPTDFPNRIHAKLEQHSRNFFHWFTRNCYFLVRRAVLPYFVLLLCLLDLRVLLLGWVTFGANLVWLLTLYNNRLFRAPRKATAEAD